MANEHPFQQLFENLGRIPTFQADSVNHRAYEVLAETLSVPLEQPGRCILLRAPRAGHGKTHLLSRIQRGLGGTHEFIPLHAPFGCRIDGASVLVDTLRSLARPLPASGGLCSLDLVARKLFSLALQPLVKSGEVPCQDREGALAALRLRPVETFDFHHPNAVTAHWAKENFQVLGQRLSLELAARSSAPLREVSYWVDLLFRFSSTALDSPARMEVLAEAVQNDSGLDMERLEALLGLLSLLKRVVLVADDLEVFSTDETASLRLAGFLGSLRQSVDRPDVILSLNRDIWDRAFLPRLSGGLADRLSEVVVELEPLSEDEMAALLDSRVPGLGSRVLARIDRNESGNHARGLIRAAGLEWLKATAMDSAAAAAKAPSQVLPEVEIPLPVAIPQTQVVAPPSQSETAVAEPLSPAQPRPVAVEPEPRVEIPPPLAVPVESPAPEIPTTSTVVAIPQPPPQPAVAADNSPVPLADATPAESNRVDELLRQFRERYGRGSL